MSNHQNQSVSLIECPRDAWQGASSFIPTETKLEYLQELMLAGFETVDAGSFVSPRAVPQVRDTSQLLDRLDLTHTRTKILAIVANLKGAEQACEHRNVHFLGYPFSISETFQQKNTNSTIGESFERVKSIFELCGTAGKQLVVYISMGFGNPYGDPWDTEIVAAWTDKLAHLGIRIISLADTIGMARTSDIGTLFTSLTKTFPELTFGAHFHSRPDTWLEKIEAAYEAGCRRFDGTISGFGGCPFAQDTLVGNIATENLVRFAASKSLETQLNPVALEACRRLFQEKISRYIAP